MKTVALVGPPGTGKTVLLRLQPEMPFHYAKTTRGGKTPDYIVNLDGHPMVIEVGGRGKGRSQFKDDAYERKVVLFDGEVGGMRPGVRVPLFCVGFA